MTIPTDKSTYDIPGAPRRPSLEDMGGAGLEDDQDDPPDALTMPSAAAMNQGERQIAAAHAVLPVATVWLRVSGGNHVVDSFASLTTLIDGTDLVVTVNGTGDTSITWPANSFPAPLGPPRPGGITGTTIGQMAVESITNGFRVRTANATGTATTLPCAVDVY